MCHYLIMKNISNKFKQLVNVVLSYFPSPLPIGITEFEKWADSVLALTPLPNNESMKWSLATMILHSDKGDAYKAKRYFARCLHKAAANEIAGAYMHELKEKQKRQMQEEAAKAAQAASEVSNEPQQ